MPKADLEQQFRRLLSSYCVKRRRIFDAITLKTESSWAVVGANTASPTGWLALYVELAGFSDLLEEWLVDRTAQADRVNDNILRAHIVGQLNRAIVGIVGAIGHAGRNRRIKRFRSILL